MILTALLAIVMQQPSAAAAQAPQDARSFLEWSVTDRGREAPAEPLWSAYVYLQAGALAGVDASLAHAPAGADADRYRVDRLTRDPARVHEALAEAIEWQTRYAGSDPSAGRSIALNRAFLDTEVSRREDVRERREAMPLNALAGLIFSAAAFILTLVLTKREG